MFSGGKRLRPVLVLAAAEACGASAARVVPAACALECLHTYSLIHDDLPVMDDDDLRRGRPTCHKVFGDGAALLAADALLTYAFELLAENGRGKDVSARRALEAVAVLAKAAGMAGMVAGQMADVEAENRTIGLPQLQFIHVHKTGKLIQAAVIVGALLGGGTSRQQRALAAYGESLGLAFQITDDILNVVGDPGKLGKATGTDASAGKATYAAFFGIEESRRRVKALIARCQKMLRPFGAAAEPLAALATYVGRREA